MNCAPGSDQFDAKFPALARREYQSRWVSRKFWIFRDQEIGARLFGLALCAVPASIAVAEGLLVGSLFCRLIALGRRREKVDLPRVFWLWLLWASLELFSWLHSPELRAGREIRHLLLIAGLFLLVPVLDSDRDRVAVWRGIVFVATVSSLVLIAQFTWRLFFYRGELDPIIYLRGGGLLHHWMIYGTVETLVFASLLSYGISPRRTLVVVAGVRYTHGGDRVEPYANAVDLLPAVVGATLRPDPLALDRGSSGDPLCPLFLCTRCRPVASD